MTGIEKEKIINGIDLSKYFKNHYDSWGRLYCIEYKGNPLELQNDIKRLQEENKKLKENQCCLETCEYIATEIIRYTNVCEVNSKYKQALEEIREMTSVNAINTCWEILNTCDDCKSKKDCGIQSPITKLKFIENKINEALNDRN